MGQKLGKGLSALIPDTSDTKEKVVSLKIDQISASPFQPRSTFQKDQESLIAPMPIFQKLKVTLDGSLQFLLRKVLIRLLKILIIGKRPLCGSQIPLLMSLVTGLNI